LVSPPVPLDESTLLQFREMDVYDSGVKLVQLFVVKRHAVGEWGIDDILWVVF
jgi:hypothetical protein